MSTKEFLAEQATKLSNKDLAEFLQDVERYLDDKGKPVCSSLLREAARRLLLQ